MSLKILTLDCIKKLYSLSLSRILIALQKIADELPLPPGRQNLVIRKRHITLGITSFSGKENFAEGVNIRAFEMNNYGLSDISSERSNIINMELTDFASIFLPKHLLSRARGRIPSQKFRITTFLFDNAALFSTKQDQQRHSTSGNSSINAKWIVNSKVFSAAIKSVRVQCLKKEEELESAFLPQFPVKDRLLECVFWDFNGSG